MWKTVVAKSIISKYFRQIQVVTQWEQCCYCWTPLRVWAKDDDGYRPFVRLLMAVSRFHLSRRGFWNCAPAAAIMSCHSEDVLTRSLIYNLIFICFHRLNSRLQHQQQQHIWSSYYSDNCTSVTRSLHNKRWLQCYKIFIIIPVHLESLLRSHLIVVADSWKVDCVCHDNRGRFKVVNFERRQHVSTE